MKAACILFLLLHATLTSVLAEAPSGKMQRITSPDQVPEGLQKSDWQSIREAHRAWEHSFKQERDGWQARNPGQQWTTRFDGLGFMAKPNGAEWQWGLELRSYGFGAKQKKVRGKPLAVTSEVSRLSYQWDNNVREWFMNDQRGLEHGFTMERRPGGAALGAALDLVLGTRGTLKACVTADAQTVHFCDALGAPVVIYSGLKVWDARGQVLSSCFVAGPDGGLILRMEESGARYPITIDPIAQQAYLKPADKGRGGARDCFGSSVAVSGDTVVVGAPYEASSTTGINSTPNEGATWAGAAYVFVRSGTEWTQQAYLKAHQVNAGDQFGISVAVSGDTVVVGALGEGSSTTGINSTPDEGADTAGAAYVFVRSGTVWSQQAYLKASNTGVYDRFGDSIAVSGDTVVVGASREASSTTGINSTPNEWAWGAGAAYVFVRSGTEWSQQAYLKASNTEGDDYFGSSVAVSGNTVVVGAYGEASSTTGINSTPNEGDPSAGAAYVFVRSGTEWTQQAYLKAAQVSAYDSFGTSVAVSGDTVIVGAPGEDSSTTGINSTPNEGDPDAGAAYVFVRSGAVWSQQAYLKASNTGADDGFGSSVAVSGDTVVVGASREDSSTTGINSTPNEGDPSAGAAYVFVRSGMDWIQQAYIKPSNTGEDDRFGSSVAVSGDTVVVGASREDSSTTGINSTPNEGATDAGAAYVFVRSGTVWTQQVYLKPKDMGFGGAGDGFGSSVAVSGDTVVVGAIYEGSSTTGINSTPDEGARAAGAAYVFVRSGTTWSQQAYLKAHQVTAYDQFGDSIAVSGDTVVVGASGEDSSTTGINSTPNEGAWGAGAAYVFVRSGTEWSQQAYFKPAYMSYKGEGDQFGNSVAVSGDTVVVGAPGEDSSTPGINSTPNELAADSGAAYVFVRSGTEWSQQAYLKAFNTGEYDRFGDSVAVSGDTVVVGAIYEDSSTTGINSTPNEVAMWAGAAYVFVRSGTEWTQQAYLKAAQVSVYDSFGTSVAVSGDTVVVGAPGEASNTTGINSTPNEGDPSAGAAYVFVRRGTEWSQQAYLKAHQVNAGDQFGNSVAVSGDTVVVGASGEDSSTTGINSTPNELATFAGAAYVFVRSGTEWSQQAYLKAAQISEIEGFGNSVSVSGDTVVVGASGAEAAYVFVRSGMTWSQQAYLKAFNTGGYNEFGNSVAVSGDTVIVGAPYEASSKQGINSTPDEGVWGAGAAYVFVRRGTEWSQQAYLKAHQINSGDCFGNSVAVSGDTVVVGAPGEDSSTTGINSTPNELARNTGASYIFTGFGPAATYSLTVNAVSGGSISGIALDGEYLTATMATLTAVPAAGYVFTGWTGAASGTTNPLSLVMSSDKTIGADFSRIPPTIDAISDVTIEEDGTAGPLEFSVSDSIMHADALSVLGTSNNPELVPDGNIVFGGADGTRTVAVTPLENQSGSSLITVTVGNGEASATEMFLLTVTPVNDAPTISTVADTVIDEDMSADALVFTVGDVETDAESLVVSSSSSNTTLVPNENILLSGTDALRTVTVTPAANQYGNTNITLSVSDGSASTSTSFVLTVNPVNDAPTISGIADLTIDSGTSSGAITFTVDDIETPAGDLVVTSSSSNPVLVPNAGIVIGGSGASRTVTIIPVATQIGAAVITITVSDGELSAAESFVIGVKEPPFDQDFVWAKGFGGGGTDTVSGIVTDSLGNALVAADFTGIVPYGQFNLTSSGSASDLALVKVAADGKVLAAYRYGGTNADNAKAVAVDGGNNSILAGEFVTSTTIGGTTHTSLGSKDIVLLKVSPAGALLWSKRFGGTLADSVYGMSSDAGGNILIAGDFSGSITFGATTLTSSGGRDGFVVKLDPSGTPLWAIKVGGTGNDTAYSVAVSPAGQILVGGSFSGGASFGAITRSSAGGTDGFAMAVSDAGTVHWATRLGGSTNDAARAVAVDVSGAICVAGSFAGTDADFGTDILVSEGGDDAFVARLSAVDGAFLNVSHCGGAGTDAGLGLAADPYGALYLAGSYSGTAYFGGDTLSASQGPDCFVAKLSIDGSFIRVLDGGGASDERATCISTDSAGHVYVAGLFSAAAQLGSHDVTSGGSTDLFVAKVNGPAPSFGTIPAAIAVDEGDPFSIEAPAFGAGTITYQWFRDNVAIVGQNSSTLQVASATEGDDGIYRLEASNIYRTGVSPPITVSVLVPVRVLTLETPVSSSENRTLKVPLYLDSDGEVTGLTVEMAYDRDLLRKPSFDVGKELSKQNSTVVVDTVAGTVRVVGTAFPSSIAAGRKLVGTFSFTTRSVPENAHADFAITLASISDVFGAPLDGYTKLVGDQTAIARRDIPGDANNNGRLDVSDAAELIRLYANPSQIRSWDHFLNDLNLDGVLTEGDATKVLRVVTKRDDVPAFPAGMPDLSQAPVRTNKSNPLLPDEQGEPTPVPTPQDFELIPMGDPDAPAARLVLTRFTGANANKLLAQVILDNIATGQAGASFQVDYPASVLRITGASSLIIPYGGLPSGTVPQWNVLPGNDYAIQTGNVSCAAAWASAWNFTNDQPVANIVFEINPAATGQVHFPLTLSVVETGPHDAEGPADPLAVTGQVVTFTRTYADWALANLGNASADPNLDSDGDGMSNATEFAASTNPGDAASRLETTSAAHTPEGFTIRWHAAYGVNYRVRWSGDLLIWEDLVSSYPGNGAEVEVNDPGAPAGGRFYRVEVIQP